MGKTDHSKIQPIQSPSRVTPEQAERNRLATMEAMRNHPPKSKASLANPRDVVLILRLARSASGLSAQEVADRMGIDAASLSRLEAFCRSDRTTDEQPNPTVDTLNKYAAAVGKRIEVQLIEAES